MTTDPEQYHRIKSIFEKAVDIPSGSKRDVYLDDICHGDDNLRSEVESLLGDYDSGDDFLETPAMGAGFAVHVDELKDDYSEDDAFSWLPDDRIIGGKYHIQSLLAFGGMGAVYEATQENPSRTVALKVMRRGFAGRSIRRRFEYECEALAKLQHPHIAHLYDCGIHYIESVRKGGEGISYFVMEYIDNAKTIAEWVQTLSLGTRDRLRLFLDVCEAIQHGHQRGIIHRDIKPGNILVGSDGEVKVIDFGVACMTNSDIAVTTMHTDIGQLIGTVQYMSPEQCAGDINDIDVRSDVYSLGLILYELLTDELPYDVSGQSVVQAVKTVQEHLPKRLSTIHRSLRGDLETIVLKALAKERKERYQSVDEMAQDIAHYLNREPIVARPTSMIYRTAKFVERYRWQTATVSALTLLILIVIVAVIMGQLAMRASRNEQLAMSIAQGAKQNSALAAILAVDPSGARDILNQIPQQSRYWEWNHINSTVDQSVRTIDLPVLDKSGNWLDFDVSNDGKMMVTTTADAVIIWDLRTYKQLNTIQKSDDRERFLRAAISPGSEYVAIALIKEQTNAGGSESPPKDSYVRIVKLEDRTIQATAEFGVGIVNNIILFLQDRGDDPVLAVAYGDPKTHNNEIRLLRLQRGEGTAQDSKTKPHLVEVARLIGHTWDIRSLALGRTGKYLASTSYDLTTRIWDISSPDKARCVAVLRGHEKSVVAASFSPDDVMLATASLDKSIKLWDVKKSIQEYTREGESTAMGVNVATLLGHGGGVTDIAFSPLGKDNGSWLLASGSTDNTIRLWEVEPKHQSHQMEEVYDHNRRSIFKGRKTLAYRQISKLHGQPYWIFKMKFLPNGTRFVSMSQDGTIKFWLPSPVESVPTLLGHDSSVRGAAFTPDGRYIISISADKTARIWDIDQAVEVCKIPADMALCIATTKSNGRVIAVAGAEDGTIYIWDITNPRKPISRIAFRAHPDSISTVIANRDGTRLLSAGLDGTARLWNLSQSSPQPVILEHPMPVGCAVFSPEDRWIITGTGSLKMNPGQEVGRITVWDANTHEPIATYTEHDADITSLAVRMEGNKKWLISTSQDNTAIIWDASDLPSLHVLHRLTGHTGPVLCSAIHPMEPRLATGSADCTIKIWDIETGAEMATLRGHIGAVTDLAFSPDGKSLTSTSSGHEGNDNSIKLWETKWDPGLAKLRQQAKQEIRRNKAEAAKEKEQGKSQ